MSHPSPSQSQTPPRPSLPTRIATRIRALFHHGFDRVSFMGKMFSFLYTLYPEASYLSAKRPQNVAVASQLGHVAEGLSGIAQTVDDVYNALPHDMGDFNWVVDTMQENLCNNCLVRAKCWSGHYHDLMDGLFALKPILEQTEHVGVEQFTAGLSYCQHPAAMASEMTRAYALYRSRNEAKLHTDALRISLTEQYGAVADALESLSAQLSTQGIPEYYKTRRVVELFTRLGMPPSECAVTQGTTGQMRVAVTLARVEFTEGELLALTQDVGHVCRRKVAPPQKLSCGGVTTLIFQEKATLRPEFGVSFAPAKGKISGDAVQQFCHGTSAEMILCDGMGTGCPAAVDGNLAAELTARLLKVGFTAETAARLVNIALSMKGEEESCATLDLISVDLYTGNAELFKAGAVASFVVQGGTARAIGAESLPVGILPEVMADKTTLQLGRGDAIVLVSDGVLFEGDGWILQQLARASAVGQSAQGMATLLVKTARAHAVAHGDARPDDISAAVMLLHANDD